LFLKGLPRLCLKMRRPSKSKNPVSDENGPDFYRLPLPTKEQHAVARSNTTTPESEINDPAVEVVDDGPLPFLAHEEERALSPSIVLQSQDAINGNNTFDSFSSNLVFQKVGGSGTATTTAMSLPTQQHQNNNMCQGTTGGQNHGYDSYNMQNTNNRLSSSSSYQMMLPPFDQSQFSFQPAPTRNVPLSTFVSQKSGTSMEYTNHMLRPSPEFLACHHHQDNNGGGFHQTGTTTCAGGGPGDNNKSNGFLSSLQAQINQHQAILAQIQSTQQNLSSGWNTVYESSSFGNGQQNWGIAFDC